MKYIWYCFLSCFLLASQLTSAAAPDLGPSVSPASLTEKDFNTLFPLRNKFYTYKAFHQALAELSKLEIQIEMKGPFLTRITRKDAKTGHTSVVREDPGWNEAWAKEKPYHTFSIQFREFANNGNAVLNKRELAAFFAQVAHETRNGHNGSYNDGLMLVSELNTSSNYSADNKVYLALPGKKYYGRGPLQLSYNGNYGFISECVFGDPQVLLGNPDLLSTDAVVSFESAICFWMMPQSLKPSAHQVMTGKWSPTAEDTKGGRKPGFGMVTNIVNGPLECNRGEGQENMLDRIGYYRAFLKILNATDPNCACSCGNMLPY